MYTFVHVGWSETCSSIACPPTLFPSLPPFVPSTLLRPGLGGGKVEYLCSATGVEEGGREGEDMQENYRSDLELINLLK